MKHRHSILIISICCSFAVSGCIASEKARTKISPSKVEKSETGLPTVTLTPDAEERLGIEVKTIEQNTLPASSVLYDPSGRNWIYVRLAPNQYQRQEITLRKIQGTVAIVESTLKVGTECVFIGAAELYGTESGVGK
jgi:hypothetical protein